MKNTLLVALALLLGCGLVFAATVTLVHERVDALTFDPDTDYVNRDGAPSGAQIQAFLAEEGRVIRFTTTAPRATAACADLVGCADGADFVCNALGATAISASWAIGSCDGRCDDRIRLRVVCN